MMRRSLASALLVALSACSLQFPGSSNDPASPRAASPAVGSPNTAALEAIPAELATSLHYRRSDAAHAAFAPVRAWAEKLLPLLELTDEESMQVRLVLDELAKIRSIDLILAAPTAPLVSAEDLEDVVLSNSCVLVQIEADAGQLTAMAPTLPVEAPFTLAADGEVVTLSGPACDAFPFLKDAAAVSAYAAAVIPTGASLVSVEHGGHALLHDPVLWAAIEEQYRAGVEEMIAESSEEQEALVREIVGGVESFVTSLNIWALTLNERAAVSSWSPQADGSWMIDITLDEGTPELAEIARRGIVGMLESGVLVHTRTVEQTVTGSVKGSVASIRATIKNPDASVFLGSQMSPVFLLGMLGSGSATLFTNAQEEARAALLESELQQMEIEAQLDALQLEPGEGLEDAAPIEVDPVVSG